jgi:hypothetical protein
MVLLLWLWEDNNAYAAVVVGVVMRLWRWKDMRGNVAVAVRGEEWLCDRGHGR